MLIAAFFLNAFRSRFSLTKSQYFLIAASINVILALTLRWWLWIGSPPMFWLLNVTLWESALKVDANWVFNFLLFLPAAFFLSKFLTKSFQVFFLLLFLSFGIETVQGIFEWGSSDPSDWVANSIGSLVGIVVASKINFKKS